MSMESQDDDDLAGALLLAHPGLNDPHFARAVVLISAHSPEEGTLGVVVNHSLNATLGMKMPDYAFGPLKDVPLYLGGPVMPGQMLFAAWSWNVDTGVFQLSFGIDEERAKQLLEEDPNIKIRAFLGHSGWSGGQLQSEREQDAWLVTPVSDAAICELDGEILWRHYVQQLKPEWAVLADAPEDPTLN